MAEMILPGVYIEVRPEGLIIPERVTVGNVGVVGTASKGELNKPKLLSSYIEAREYFGEYDMWQGGGQDELTLVRAIEIAFNHGAIRVFGVRVGGGAAKASAMLASAGGDNVNLLARSEGKWGNALSVSVAAADKDAYIEDVKLPGGAAIQLKGPVVKNARNRIQLTTNSNGLTRTMKIYYDDDPAIPNPLPADAVQVTLADGTLTFATAPDAADEITASYFVAMASAVTVTLKQGRATRSYTVISGDDLFNKITDADTPDPWVTAEKAANSAELLNVAAEVFLAGGQNGESGADYSLGLEAMTSADAHIIVAAGQDDRFAGNLDAHCQNASSDALRRERIAVVGTRGNPDFDTLLGHDVASDRVIFVSPGITTDDAASTKEDKTVTLPGSYAAAAVAGLLSSYAPHISLTNKTLRVKGLEKAYTSGELTQLLQNRVLPLEERQGFRVVRAITTSTNTAWKQITTRRIVDYARIGVRGAANSYIGLLNNERVRGAMRATINSFLAEMVEDEMLVAYTLEVTATREEERQGIARVTMTLQPTFSIDFIKVTMFLQ